MSCLELENMPCPALSLLLTGEAISHGQEATVVRNIAEALVLGIVFGALYGLLQAILTAATGQRIEWTDVSGKTFLVAIVSGIIVGALRAWQLSRSGRPFGWHNLGAILAVIGGLLLVAYGMWPAMPL